LINHPTTSRVHPTRGGPKAWGLGEWLTAPYRESKFCYKMQNTKFENLKGRDHSEDIGTGGRIIL